MRVSKYPGHQRGGKQLTLEDKEDKEGKVITGLCRVADMVEKAKVIIRSCDGDSSQELNDIQGDDRRTKRVVVIGHDISESIRDISTGDDFF
jgi:hypothetical protein